MAFSYAVFCTTVFNCSSSISSRSLKWNEMGRKSSMTEKLCRVDHECAVVVLPLYSMFCLSVIFFRLFSVLFSIDFAQVLVNSFFSFFVIIQWHLKTPKRKKKTKTIAYNRSESRTHHNVCRFFSSTASLVISSTSQIDGNFAVRLLCLNY